MCGAWSSESNEQPARRDGETDMPAIDREQEKPVKVTISDPDTGEVLEEKVVQNDYCIVCTGRRYVKSMQRMGQTHMLAIALRKPGEPDGKR